MLEATNAAIEGLGQLRISGNPLLETQKLAALAFRGWLEQLHEKKLAMGHIVTPMGSGKTAMAILFAEMVRGKAIFFTYTKQLGEQVIRDYEQHQDASGESNRRAGRCYGEKIDPSADFLVASFQSRDRWVPRVNWDEVRLIFVDEADVNGLSSKREEFLKELASQHGIPIIGLSATQEQSSGKSIEKVFPDEILSLPIPQVLPKMRNLDLMPDMRFHDVYFDLQFQVDSDALKKRKDHEVDQKTVREFIRSTTWNKLLLEYYREKYSTEEGLQKGVVIFRDNLLVEDFCQQAAEVGVRAKGFTGDETTQTLSQLRRDLAAGKIDLLVGSKMLGRGLHIPEVRVVLNSSITYSPQLFWQANGRVFSLDPNDPEKKVEMISFLPRYTLDRNTGLPMPPEARPLCFASFFDPDYYPPVLSRESALERGRWQLRERPYALDLSELKEIRSAKEVGEIIRAYHQKPVAFEGKPGIIARAIAQLQEGSFGQINRIMHSSNTQLKAIERELEDADYQPADIGLYDHAQELTYSEEKQLIEDYMTGKSSPSRELKEKSEAAAQRLLKAHDPVVRALAQLFSSNLDDLDDLVQAGRLELWRSLQKFKSLKRARFLKFAYKGLYGTLEREAGELRRISHVPDATQECERKRQQSIWTFYSEHGRMPTTEELLELIQKDPEVLERADIAAPLIKNELTPFEETVDPHEVADPVEQAAKSEARQAILDLLKRNLPYRDREILKLRHGLGDGHPFTTQKIASIFNISGSSVKAREYGAIGVLQASGDRRKWEQLQDEALGMEARNEGLRIYVDGLPPGMVRTHRSLASTSHIILGERASQKAGALQDLLVDSKGNLQGETASILSTGQSMDLILEDKELLHRLGIKGLEARRWALLRMGKRPLEDPERQEKLITMLREHLAEAVANQLNHHLLKAPKWMSPHMSEMAYEAKMMGGCTKMLRAPRQMTPARLKWDIVSKAVEKPLERLGLRIIKWELVPLEDGSSEIEVEMINVF